eukprot:3589491-Rhodomonas_salina.2
MRQEHTGEGRKGRESETRGEEAIDRERERETRESDRERATERQSQKRDRDRDRARERERERDRDRDRDSDSDSDSDRKKKGGAGAPTRGRDLFLSTPRRMWMPMIGCFHRMRSFCSLPSPPITYHPHPTPLTKPFAPFAP